MKKMRQRASYLGGDEDLVPGRLALGDELVDGQPNPSLRPVDLGCVDVTVPHLEGRQDHLLYHRIVRLSQSSQHLFASILEYKT